MSNPRIYTQSSFVFINFYIYIKDILKKELKIQILHTLNLKKKKNKTKLNNKRMLTKKKKRIFFLNIDSLDEENKTQRCRVWTMDIFSISIDKIISN